MQCTNPFFLASQGFFVPCGKCLACRISKRREWSLRLLHQLSTTPDACFLTLTYDNDNLPQDLCVHKRHLQLFFKRFRKSLGDKKIKYFSCGEYGDDSFRPHYHIILFGVSVLFFLEKVTNYILFQRRGFTYFSCTLPSWPFGYCVSTSVSLDTISYVTGYVMKKIRGSMEKYKSLGLTPPFQLQSQGLGLGYALDNAFRLQREKFTYFKGSKCSLPRYYRKKLSITAEDMYPLLQKTNCQLSEKLFKKGCLNNIERLSLDITGRLPYFVLNNVNPHNEATLLAKEKLFNSRNKL